MRLFFSILLFCYCFHAIGTDLPSFRHHNQYGGEDSCITDFQPNEASRIFLSARISFISRYTVPDSSFLWLSMHTSKPYRILTFPDLPFTDPVFNSDFNGFHPAFLNTAFFARDSLPPFKRFLYSGYAMLTSSIGGHMYLYLRTCKTQNWPSKFKWRNIENTFTKPPVWEEDHWSFNYVVHPYMGSLTYLAARNRGATWIESYLLSTFHSAFYEYFVASSLQRPSVNDMIVTPLGGMFVGEIAFALKNHLLMTDHLSFFRKLIITCIDPYEVFRHGFDYNKMLK